MDIIVQKGKHLIMLYVTHYFYKHFSVHCSATEIPEQAGMGMSLPAAKVGYYASGIATGIEILDEF
ncbi:MAG: hypothetical protein ACTTH7_05315 [Treponema sp.]